MEKRKFEEKTGNWKPKNEWCSVAGVVEESWKQK